MYFITTKRMLEVCFSAHPNIQYRTVFLFQFGFISKYFLTIPYRAYLIMTLVNF